MDLVEGAECEFLVSDVSIRWGMWGQPRIQGSWVTHLMEIRKSLSSTSLVVDRWIRAKEATHF